MDPLDQILGKVAEKYAGYVPPTLEEEREREQRSREFAEKAEAKRRENAMAHRRNSWPETLRGCGVPPRYLRVPISLPVPAEPLAWATSPAPDPWCLTLFGSQGTGKTWEAVRLLGEFSISHPDVSIRHGCIRFEDVAVWLDDQKASLDDARPLFAAAAGAQFLVLDDLGGERSTDYARSQLTTLLRIRYNEMLPTIVTTNATNFSNLAEATDPQIASRLSSGLALRMSGPDRRLRANRKG